MMVDKIIPSKKGQSDAYQWNDIDEMYCPINRSLEMARFDVVCLIGKLELVLSPYGTCTFKIEPYNHQR